MTEDPDAMMAGADDLFSKMNNLCAGRPAADVMYAIGMMIGKAIEDNSSTTDLEATMSRLREVAALELSINHSGIK